MRQVLTAGLSALALCYGAAASGAAGVEPGEVLSLDRELAASARAALQDPNDMRVYWKQGLRLETADKRVKFRFGGRFHHDWTWQTADDGVGDLGSAFDFDDGTQFRRARISFSGGFDDTIDWYAAYDFSSGGVAIFRDVYLGYRGSGYRVRVGQYKQPFSIEWHTTSNGITFMERGSLNQTIVNRGLGVMVHNDAKAEGLTWAAGFFREGDERGFDAGDGDYTLTGRITGTPIHEDGGERVMHIGGAASFRGMDEFRGSLRYDQDLAPRTIDSGVIRVDEAILLGLEFAWLNGPWSVQAEVISEDVHAKAGSDPEVFAWYAFVSKFLTHGDRRVYKPASGAFGKVTPQRPLGVEGGKGALELALRFSQHQFDDIPAFTGGDEEMKAVTLGLNWYQNYHTRIMFNMVGGEQDDFDGTYLGAGLRFQFFF